MTYVMTESEAKEMKNMTANQLFDILGSYPYPGATNLSGGAMGFMCFKVDGLWVAYDRGMWNVELHETQYPITPNFPPFGELTVRDVHAEISRVVKIGKSLHANTRAVATETNTTPSPTSTWEQIKGTYWVGPDLPTEQTLVSTDRYQELEAELAKVTAERDERTVRVKQKTDVIVAQTAQIQQHADGWEQTEAQLEAMTTSRDELQKKVDFIEGRTSDLLAEREQLFTKIDRLKSKAGLLSVVCRRLCGDENASIETVHAAIDRCHEEFSTIEFIKERFGIDPDGPVVVSLGEVRSLVTQAVKSLGEKTVEVDRLKISLSATEAQLREVEQGRDHDDGIRSEIAVKVGLDSGASLGLILETVKTVEVSKLQEGLTNYKAQVEGLTKRVEQLAFERDTERVGNKWLSETIEDLKRTTVKLPNEHTLRRLFNRHNTPDKYDDGTTIPTIERFLLIIENLCRNADCAERRFEELNAISTRVNTESEDAHATLDEMGIPRWTTVGNHNERYLSLSARIRSVFNTHTKV